MPRQKRVAIFIDFANIDRAIGDLTNHEIRIDFDKLISMVTVGKEVASKSIYLVDNCAKNKAQCLFLGYLTRAGFQVVVKKTKSIKIGDNQTKKKANFDVEIAWDICESVLCNQCEEVMLFSGDSDFAYILVQLKKMNIKTTVVSLAHSISSELMKMADEYLSLDIMTLRKVQKRRSYECQRNGHIAAES
jgi:uncharacterized LabA/DUF88 family protein